MSSIKNATGVRHNAFRLNAHKKLIYNRMRRFNWPPQECSAIHPIEPFGKQFFIFNAFKRDPNFDNEVCNTVKPLLNPNNEKIPSETVLCVCDFAKRPLMFLNYLDFKILQASMDKIKEGFKKMEEKLDKVLPFYYFIFLHIDLHACTCYHVHMSGAILHTVYSLLRRQLHKLDNHPTPPFSPLQTNYLDTKFGLMLKYNLNKTYGMQRVKKGEHNSWGMKKGVFRSRKT